MGSFVERWLSNWILKLLEEAKLIFSGEIYDDALRT